MDQPGEQAEFEQLVQEEPYREVRAMATTWYEQGLEKGREEGRQEAAATWYEQGFKKGHQEGIRAGRLEAALSILLEERFGPLGPAAQKRLESLPAEDLPELIRKAAKAQSLAELGLGD
jgi:flagellar biosynthesis/type III secretory pathway protein FliH